MKSVLHVLSSLQLGGAERFVIDLSRLQRQQGLDARILSLGGTDDTLVDEVQVHDIPLTICTYRQRFRHYLQIYRLFREVDIVQLHSPYALRFLAPLIFLFPRKRIIYTRHGLRPLQSRSWQFLHWFMRSFLHRVSFVTDSGLDVFKENFGWENEELCVIENGVYVPEEVTISVDPTIRFGSVGRMVELKGQPFLLRALKRVEEETEQETNSQPYELHFFGAGPLEEALRDQSRELCHPERIHFHGIVIDREAIYSSMHVLIVSSETEGLSLAIMEAMARGICVIATDVGGNSRLVEDGVNGFIVPYSDEAEMARAIEKLLRNPDMIRQFGERAREFIKTNHSLYTTHLAYLECYSS